MRKCAGELAEKLTRGASARLITGKDSEYKMFLVENNFGLGGVGILVARKWTDKIFNDDKALLALDCSNCIDICTKKRAH